MAGVFISATSVDLKEYVKALEQSLRIARYQVVTMGYFGAQPDAPCRASLQEVGCNTSSIEFESMPDIYAFS